MNYQNTVIGEKSRISTFWLVCMAVLLSLCYLLPNHYLPWSCFHAEAWASVSLLVPAIWLGVWQKAKAQWHYSTLMIVIAMGIAGCQYYSGLIPIFGTFWINTGYLFGVVIALQTGQIWEKNSAGQCMDYLSIALIVGALLSFPMQLAQWLDLSWSTPLLMQVRDVHRPYANMAQPNLLADLYLLGIISISWNFSRKKIPAFLAIGLAVLFLIGAALTGSRTAWINATFLLIFYIFFSRKDESAERKRVALFLWLIFVAILMWAPDIQALILDQEELSKLKQLSTESINARINVARMMLKASTLHPFVGYGWGQIIKVNFVFEDAMGVQRGIFNYSHNFILDLVLWFGYPLAILFLSGCLYWMYRLFFSERKNSNWHTQAFVAILCIHSMVEFPIYYTYFIFPMAMLLGTIQPKLFVEINFKYAKIANFFLLIGAVVFLAVTIRDYFKIEKDFYLLRFESRGYVERRENSKPDVLALTQLQDHLQISRRPVKPIAKPEELSHMEDVVRVTPGAYIMYKLAVQYGLTGNESMAKFWLKQLCEKTIEGQCKEAHEKWKEAGKAYLNEGLMPWPNDL